MNFLYKNLPIFFLSLILAFIYSSLVFFDTDIAYPSAFDSVFHNDGFRSFWLKQGYPSVSLFLFYYIFSSLSSSYDFMHYSMILTYCYSALLLLKLAPPSIFYRLLYILFFFLSFYSLVLTASAEKMLLAFSLVLLGLYHSLKKNNITSFVFYSLSFFAHSSIFILIALLNLRFISDLNHSFFVFAKSLKLQLRVYYIPISIFIASSFFLLPAIIGKFSFLFAKNSSDGNGISLMLIFILFSYLFLDSKVKYYPIIYSVAILLLQIPLGRIAWFSAFFIVLFPYISSFCSNKMNIYLVMLMPICAYQLYKFCMSINTALLFS